MFCKYHFKNKNARVTKNVMKKSILNGLENAHQELKNF